MIDDGSCVSFHESTATSPVPEPATPWKLFSYAGYIERTVRIDRVIDGTERHHCVKVAWPPGPDGHDTHHLQIFQKIDDGWLRAIENTLQRLPWRHLQAVRRMVIDDRPKEHGVAPFDRETPGDARDGHTIWLHTRLFAEPNHWSHGNYGQYWSYHTQNDGSVFDDQPANHTLYSPVLLHEIGHLIAYNVMLGGVATDAVPECAKICPDRSSGREKKRCQTRPIEEREAGCISAYCMPFHLPMGSENWAEQYRFYYQSSETRALLEGMKTSCFDALSNPAGSAHPDGFNFGRIAPWKDGLPDGGPFHKTRWESCGGKACKPY
jgi:hypothetical protein